MKAFLRKAAHIVFIPIVAVLQWLLTWASKV